MASEKITAIIESVKGLTVLELKEAIVVIRVPAAIVAMTGATTTIPARSVVEIGRASCRERV